MRVWITRTYPSARKSTKAFETAGFDVVTAPLLEVHNLEVTLPEFASDDLLIFTSQNGLRAYANQRNTRSHRVITVGDKTAELARSFGFTDVISASGQSDDIIKLIKQDDKKEAVFHHLSGDITRGDIVERLSGLGFKAKRHVLYKTQTIQSCPIPSLDNIDVVVFHSPLAAQSFATLLTDSSNIVTLSISKAAAEPVKAREKIIADAPNEAAMLRALIAYRENRE